LDERRITEFFYEHWRKILGGVVGLIVALIFITFGFLSGLFIIICVGIGIYIGYRVDKEGVDEFIDKFRQR